MGGHAAGVMSENVRGAVGYRDDPQVKKKASLIKFNSVIYSR